MQHNYYDFGKRNRRSLFLITLLAFCISCSTLKSDLTVQPGTQFELGGNRNGSFTVQLKNTGDVPVTITERKANGQPVTLGVFYPGARQTVPFSSGSTALIANSTTKPARLFLVVSGDTDLSMREQAR